MNCTNHSEAPAVTTCTKCGKALCEQCAIHVKGSVTCKYCLEAGNFKAPRMPRVGKSPGLAAFFSLLPGLGQAYVGYYRAAFINILVVGGLMTMLVSGAGALEPFMVFFLIFFWVFNLVDAARRARLYNDHIAGKERPEKLPTDSPLIGGLVLVVIGLILTLHITFDLSMEFLEPVWPIVILLTGIYLVWKYRQTKQKMIESDKTRVDRNTAFGSQSGFHDSRVESGDDRGIQG